MKVAPMKLRNGKVLARPEEPRLEHLIPRRKPMLSPELVEFLRNRKKEPTLLRSGRVVGKAPAPSPTVAVPAPEQERWIAAYKPPLERKEEDLPVESCGHICDTNASGKCCICADKREQSLYYAAYNKADLNQFSLVQRNYYYCPYCKEKPLQEKAEYTMEKLKEYVKALELENKQKDEKILSLTIKLNNSEVHLWNLQRKVIVQ
jgi:hypothetical protein